MSHGDSLRLCGCACLAVGLIPITGLADCRPWAVDYGASKLGFTAVQADAEFDGVFRRFRADICFSAESLVDSHFDVVVDVASVDTQNRERDEALTGPDFFAVLEYPSARFVARDFAGDGSGGYVARGELTLRGVALPLTVPFRFLPATGSGETRLTGRVPVSRLAFGIGQGEWQDTTWVGDEVRVGFLLQLRPAGTDRGNESQD